MNRAHVASLGEAIAQLEVALDEIDEFEAARVRSELAALWRAFALVAQDAGEPVPPRPPRIPS